eukprot:6214832-Pleurochrysis_carterae.AAC.2
MSGCSASSNCTYVGISACSSFPSSQCLTLSTSYVMAFVMMSCMSKDKKTLPCIDTARSESYLSNSARIYQIAEGITLSARSGTLFASATSPTAELVLNDNVQYSDINLNATKVYSSFADRWPLGVACSYVDIDADAKVGMSDVSALLPFFGMNVEEAEATETRGPACGFRKADLDHSGTIDVRDVIQVINDGSFK